MCSLRGLHFSWRCDLQRLLYKRRKIDNTASNAAVRRVLEYGAKKHQDALFENGHQEFTEKERLAKVDRHLQAGRCGYFDYDTSEDALVHARIQLDFVIEMRERERNA